ncbi:DBH-like monooxygenase protein 1 [Macrobrachium rosenbergii]|uniref:DBH-like monooxygenase protein 1 n=1 Tax=Macrobrachium rosenbergii TaxID=79674 RepID=UPI0034D7B537
MPPTMNKITVFCFIAFASVPLSLAFKHTLRNGRPTRFSDIQEEAYPAYSDTDADAYSDTEADAYSDTVADAYSDTEADTYSDTEADAYSDTEADAYSHTEADTYSNNEADAYSDTEVDAYSDAEADAYSDTEADAYLDTEVDAYSDTEVDAYSDTEADAYSETEADAFSDTEAGASSDTEADAFPDTEAVAYSDTDADKYSDTEADAYSDTEADAYSDTETNAHSDTETDAHSDTEPDAYPDTEPDAHLYLTADVYSDMDTELYPYAFSDLKEATRSDLETTAFLTLRKPRRGVDYSYPEEEEYSDTEEEALEGDLTEDASADFRNKQVLDPEEKFSVQWTVYWQEQVIMMKMVAETRGWVSLGLSPSGKVTGADLITGWVDGEGQGHIRDQHGMQGDILETDDHSDWDLLSAVENETHTVLVVRRELNTCDVHDLPFLDTIKRVIYAYSPEDPANDSTITYTNQGVKNGSKYLSFLQGDPEEGQGEREEERGVSVWSLNFNHTLGKKSRRITWCKIEKFPQAAEEEEEDRVHYIGYDFHHGENSEVHLKHVAIYECAGDASSWTYHQERERLDHYASQKGHACYSHDTPPDYSKCNLNVILWTPGTKSVREPEHVGVPLLSDDGSPAYFMVEAQYENSNSMPNVNVQWKMDIYYTRTLRRYESGILKVGSTLNFAMLIPPGQKTWKIAGHCPDGCLNEGVPNSGIKVYQVLLHARSLCTAMRIRHFRDGEELPPIVTDDYYDANYQPILSLWDERTVLPTDHLTTECVYGSMSRKNSTFSGYGEEDEACLGYLFYYPRVSLAECSSVTHHDVIKAEFHTGELEDEENLLLQSPLLEPLNPRLPRMGDVFFQDYINALNWSEFDTRNIQEDLYRGTHVARCLLTAGIPAQVSKLTAEFPEAYEYEEVEGQCPSFSQLESTSNSQVTNASRRAILTMLLFHAIITLVMYL